MPRIRNKLPPEIKENLTRSYKGIRFEGSCGMFSVGDKVIARSPVNKELVSRIGVVIGFDAQYALVYFKDSNFNGARGRDICTMYFAAFKKLRS